MAKTTQDWQRYADIFRLRAGRPLPPLRADLDYTRLPPSLARSLAIFQLGESGGGSIVAEARASALPGAGEAFAEAVAGFVAEEHRHANVLAVCVRLTGGRLRSENWTARCFVGLRRLFGLRLKVLILLVAEIIGLGYYELVASRLPKCLLRNWLLELAGDERVHLELHCEFLELQVNTRYKQMIFIAFFRALFWCTEQAVLLDHRAAFRDLYLDRATLRGRWADYRRLAESLIVAAGSRVSAPGYGASSMPESSGSTSASAM